MNPVVLVIIGFGAIYLLKGSSTPAALTPLQAAQLAAAQQVARVQQQQNNGLGSLLASLLGPNKQQANPQAAPKSSGGGGGGLANQAGGSGASKPPTTALGTPNPGCPMAASDTNTTTGTTSGLGTGVVEHGDGTITVGGQIFCESTGQLIADGPPVPPDIANDPTDGGAAGAFGICFNNDGGLGAPAGGVATFDPTDGGAAGCFGICFQC